MADVDGLHLSHGIAAAVGAAIVAVGRVLWGALTASRRAESAAKDVTIATYAAELAHERTERAREREEGAAAVKALGERLDALRGQLEHERTQALAVAVRIRQDSTVDDAIAEDMPTVVKNRADIVAPKKSTPPKGTPAPHLPDGRYRGKLPTHRD